VKVKHFFPVFHGETLTDLNGFALRTSAYGENWEAEGWGGALSLCSAFLVVVNSDRFRAD